MKANELMIGDWVLYGDVKCKILCFIHDKCEVKLRRTGITLNPAPLKEFNPIPLTSEILEKNGWRYNDLPFVQGWEQYGITIIDNRITFGQNVSVKVEFVHQLQHALRLCGIDKEITL